MLILGPASFFQAHHIKAAVGIMSTYECISTKFLKSRCNNSLLVLRCSRLQPRDRITVVDRLRRYVNSFIEVHLIDEQVIKGRLVQVDDDLLNIFLENCVDISGKTSPAAVVMGSSISHINIVSLPVSETLDEQVFMLLQNNGEMSVEEIAKILNAQKNSVRSAITRLRRRGLLSGVSIERVSKKIRR